MPCKWMHDPEIGRWWYPQCMGGIYGKEGCTCDRRGLTKDRAAELEKRISKLERRLETALKLPNGER